MVVSTVETYVNQLINVTLIMESKANMTQIINVGSKYKNVGNNWDIIFQVSLELPSYSVVSVSFSWTPNIVEVYLLKAEVELSTNNTWKKMEFALIRIKRFGDVNGDGLVNYIDVIETALSFGSYPSHPRWNIQADLNFNGKVDIFDVALAVKILVSTH
jgi:hypothetical protein